MPDDVKNVEILPQDDVELLGGEETGEGLTSGKEKIEKTEKVDTEKVVGDKKEGTEEVIKEKEEEKEEVKEDKEEKVGEIEAKPSWSKVSEKYPNFFKEFPEIRNALGREKAYNEIFPEGVEQARNYVENSKDFSFFEEKVISG